MLLVNQSEVLEPVVEQPLEPLQVLVELKKIGQQPFNHDAIEYLNPLIQRLESWIFNASCEEWNKVHGNLTCEDYDILNNAYCRWETELEAKFTSQLNQMNSGVQLEDYPLWERFVRLLTKEINLLRDLTKGKKVLFVGSGPFPVSAMILNKLTGLELDCVDLNEAAVFASKTLLAQHQITGLHIKHHPGEDFDYSEYDIIIIALLAKPKDKILDQIAKTGKQNVSVICRTSQGPRTMLYESTAFTHQINRMWDIKHHHIAKGNNPDTISSILIKRSNEEC